jgi:PhnB protein
LPGLPVILSHRRYLRRQTIEKRRENELSKEDFMPRKSIKPIPPGLHSLTTQLWFDGNCKDAVDFYKKAFSAEQIGEIDAMPDGRVMHAHLRIGDSNIFLADTMGSEHTKAPEHYTTASLYLYVKDCDAVFDKAKRLGCDVLMPLQDAFWGDRNGELKDPYGHIWDIATNKWKLTPEEMKKAGEEWVEKHHGVMA